MILYLLMFTTFLTVFLLVIGVYSLLFASRARILQRLEANISDSADFDEKAKGANRNIKEELMNFMAVLGRLLSRKAYTVSVQQKLNQAAILMKAEEFFGIAVASAVGVFVLLYLLTNSLIISLFCAIIGFKIPDLLVSLRKNKRTLMLNSQLPEALNIISNGLRAGFSFPQAISVVGKEIDEPISEEFNRLFRENTLGKPLEEVLVNFSERTDDDDVDMIITALLIQRQVGGNLAEVLDNISYTIRERVKMKGEIRTLTAQGRLSAVIIGSLPLFLAVIISLINPEYMRLLIQETLGIIMVGGAVFLQLVGIILLRRIVNIDI